MTLTSDAKLAFVVGYVEGLYQGHCFSTWELPGIDIDDCYIDVTKSFESNWNQFIANVKYERFVAEVDSLYLDELNRKICLFNAVWIAMNLIKGTLDEARKKAMIDACIESRSE